MSILFEVIDMRSFSNLWYWIALAVLWSTASHWVMGVPFDSINRARLNGGQDGEDVVDLARVHVMRLLRLSDVSGAWLAGFGAFGLVTLLLLGFVYRVEFAQAVSFIAIPMGAVFVLSIRRARQIYDENPDLDRLCDLLLRHRLWIRVIGLASIFLAAMWGMRVNLSLPTWY